MNKYILTIDTDDPTVWDDIMGFAHKLVQSGAIEHCSLLSAPVVEVIYEKSPAYPSSPDGTGVPR